MEQALAQIHCSIFTFFFFFSLRLVLTGYVYRSSLHIPMIHLLTACCDRYCSFCFQFFGEISLVVAGAGSRVVRGDSKCVGYPRSAVSLLLLWHLRALNDFHITNARVEFHCCIFFFSLGLWGWGQYHEGITVMFACLWFSPLYSTDGINTICSAIDW